MQVTKALLVKFIENRCSRQEAELVYEHLMNNPQMLNELLSDAEWDAYDSNGVLDKQRSEDWFAVIQKQKATGKVITLKKAWRMAAAAVVLLAVSLIVYQAIKPAHKKAETLATIEPPKTNALTTQKRFVNNSSQPATYTLSDGSVITLFKNSILECNQPFESSKRDLVLHGEALFKVAKDKTKPFTVFTNDFSTTALGTVFNIRAYFKRESSVKLLSGKVVVKNLKTAAAPVYMNPGDECFFKAGNQTLELHATKATIPIAGKPVTPYEKAITETEDAIVFSNAPLQQVFNRIGSIYHVIIRVEAMHLENRKFTGTHLKADSPDEILSTIAGLNNLQLSKEGNDYLLKFNE